MLRRLLSGLLLAITACTSPGSGPPTLVGHWDPQSAELGGAPFPVANFDGGTLQLTADTYEFAGDKGTYVVVSAGPPASMDIHGQKGPNAGRTIRAIYALEDDQLIVCYQLGTGERPDGFETPKGSQVLLVRYQRMP